MKSKHLSWSKGQVIDIVKPISWTNGEVLPPDIQNPLNSQESRVRYFDLERLERGEEDEGVVWLPGAINLWYYGWNGPLGGPQDQFLLDHNGDQRK